MASEAGVLGVDPENIKTKGRLQPGKMFLVDTVAGRIISDKEIKTSVWRRVSLINEWLEAKSDHHGSVARTFAHTSL